MYVFKDFPVLDSLNVFVSFQNLFAFGDKDGSLFDAKLQHCLGLAVTTDEKTVFVADTYNHKLKKIDVTQSSVTTLIPPEGDTSNGTLRCFNEPAGMCVSSDNKKLYLVDTNNHIIKIIYLGSKSNITKIEKLTLKKLVERKSVLDKSKYTVMNCKPVIVNANGGKVITTLDVSFKNGLKLTEEAPQTWLVDLPDSTWSCVPKNGSTLKDINLVISVPLDKDVKDNFADIVFSLVTCTLETCLPKNFIVRLPVTYSKDVSTSVTRKIEVGVSPSDIQVV